MFLQVDNSIKIGKCQSMTARCLFEFYNKNWKRATKGWHMSKHTESRIAEGQYNAIAQMPRQLCDFRKKNICA